MEREEYIFKKLGNLSPMNKTLADEIVKELGEQTSAEKEIKSYHSSLETIDKYRSLLAAYHFYVKNNTPDSI